MLRTFAALLAAFFDLQTSTRRGLRLDGHSPLNSALLRLENTAEGAVSLHPAFAGRRRAAAFKGGSLQSLMRH